MAGFAMDRKGAIQGEHRLGEKAIQLRRSVPQYFSGENLGAISLEEKMERRTFGRVRRLFEARLTSWLFLLRLQSPGLRKHSWSGIPEFQALQGYSPRSH